MVLRFPGGESFLPGEEEQKLKCWLVHQKPPGLVGRLERNWKGIFASTVLTVFVVVLFFTYGIPAITNGIVRVMPAKIPKLVGQEVTASLDEHIFESSELSDDKREAITLRFDALVAQIDPLPFTPKLEFRRWGNGPNAFALSDGTVIVLDSLVKLSGISPRLDAILLHELGHIEHQHVMKSLVRSSLLSAGVAVITGESTGLLDTLGSVGVFVATNGYSREAEQQADDFAARYMKQIYGTTEPAAEMFMLFKEAYPEDGLPAWVKSHPDLDARINRLRSDNRN